MSHLSSEDFAKYAHSPVHLAVARRDYQGLRRIISALPRLAKAGDIRTETDAIAEENRAEALSAVIDRRDVPGRETPLHLAVRMGDVIAAEILMSSGADWSLQNEQGWSALQEAICAREEGIAMVIMRHYQPMAWAKWCRRLPRVIGTMQRMRDFYMEVTFHFESSVIPFIGRIAPSDTYRIWKRGSNLRADMTLAGFDGFRIQRSDQTFLFLGEGSNDGKLSPGSLCMLNHRDKEIMNALEGAGVQPSEAETAQEVAAMSQTNMYRPGIDVTQAVLVPQLTWRRQEKTEMVGAWKAKVVEMHHVQVSVKSRRVPGAMTDEELFGGDVAEEEEDVGEDYAELLTEDEKRQLETALRMDSYGVGAVEEEEEEGFEDEAQPPRLSSVGDGNKKGGNWFGWGRRSVKQEEDQQQQQQQQYYQFQQKRRAMAPGRSSLCVDKEKVSNLLAGEEQKKQRGRRSVDGHQMRAAEEAAAMAMARRQYENHQIHHHHHHHHHHHQNLQQKKKKSVERGGGGGGGDAMIRRRRVTPAASAAASAGGNGSNDDGGNHSSEYKKGLRPVLWLTPAFPLKTDELLPLLDILANKVKAVRRLRELLTTKLPPGTFPVKVAIPVVPTIRVIVTFTKFEELRSHDDDDFATPPSSPDAAKPHNISHRMEGEQHHSSNSTSSWFSWIKGSASKVAAGMSGGTSDEHHHHHLHDHETPDPFLIPTDYVWTSMDAKKRKSKEKKSKKKGRKATADHQTEHVSEL